MIIEAPFNVKICGITRLEDARYISGLMADRLGFIFTKESKRYIEPGKAGAIIEWLGGIEPVGVFMNQPVEEVNQIATRTGLSIVQLHGQEPSFYCSQLPFHIIKTISVSPLTTPQELQDEILEYAQVADEYLFDTSISSGSSTLYGGTGTPFNWDLLNSVNIPKPWYLAGGISPDTIQHAWSRVKPTGFDLSSGVESEPGIKDYDLLDKLVDSIQQVQG